MSKIFQKSSYSKFQNIIVEIKYIKKWILHKVAAFISDEGTENECSTSEDGTISNCGIGETNEILIPYEITGKNTISKY